MADLQSNEVAPHSIYSMQKIDVPYYSWAHRKQYLDRHGDETDKTKVYLYLKDPVWSRKK